MAACQNFELSQNHGHIVTSILMISADDLITDTVAACKHIADDTGVSQNRCTELTHVHISNVDIQFGTVGAQQEAKHGAQESNGLETSCKAQIIQTNMFVAVWAKKIGLCDKVRKCAYWWTYDMTSHSKSHWKP